MTKHKFYIGLLTLIVFTILDLGCVQSLTLESIDELLFAHVKSVYIFRDLPNDPTILTNEEILLLRNSIVCGMDLIEISDNGLPRFEKGDLFFVINKINNYTCNMIYKGGDNALFITKIDVNEEKSSRYKQNAQSFSNFLSGSYKFRPNIEIRKLFR